MRIDDLDTPAVIVDLDRVERNLRRFQAHCDAHGIANRPHIKTHKLTEFAKLQLELGAVGISCQKLGEAEVMAAAGIDDIFIPYNVLGTHKLARAVALAKRITLSMCCDSAQVANGVAQAMAASGREVAMFVECDTGGQRCGVATPEAALALALTVARQDGLRFGGFMTYPPAGGQSAAQAFLAQAVALAEAAGLEVPVVTSGGTPDMWTCHQVPAATEYRPGTYIYNDRSLVKRGTCGEDDCALRVITAVVSRPTADRVILDAGSKTLSSDTLGLDGFATFVEYPGARLPKMSEEHGHGDFMGVQGRPAIGERLTIIPNHACVVSNLHDRVFGVRGGEVEKEFTVAARGRVQ